MRSHEQVETQRYEYTKLQRAKAGEGTPRVATEDTKLAGNLDVAAAHSTTPANRVSRGTNPRLTEDRLRRLEAIGFQWKVKNKMQKFYQKQWINMFDRLKAFKEINGHAMVPKRYR